MYICVSKLMSPCGMSICVVCICICNALSSPTIYLRLLMNIATKGSRSPVLQNFNYILYNYNLYMQFGVEYLSSIGEI